MPLRLAALEICFEQCVGRVLLETSLVELGTKIDWEGGWPGQEEVLRDDLRRSRRTFAAINLSDSKQLPEGKEDWLSAAYLLAARMVSRRKAFVRLIEERSRSRWKFRSFSDNIVGRNNVANDEVDGIWSKVKGEA